MNLTLIRSAVVLIQLLFYAELHQKVRSLNKSDIILTIISNGQAFIKVCRKMVVEIGLSLLRRDTFCSNI